MYKATFFNLKSKIIILGRIINIVLLDTFHNEKLKRLMMGVKMLGDIN